MFSGWYPEWSRAAGLAASVCSLLLTVGCSDRGEGSSASGQVTRSDSAGIEIVTSITETWNGGDGWHVATTPSVHVGTREGSDIEALHDIVVVRSLADSILVVQRDELRLFSPTGEFVRQIGRRGEGPGEFQLIASALVCGEEILVSEVSPPRLTEHTSRGEPRTLPLPVPPSGRLTALTLNTCLDNAVIGRLGGEHVVRVDRTSGALDTLVSHSGSERYEGLAVPFGTTTLAAVHDSLIYLVDTGKTEVRVFGVDGTLRRIIRFSLAPREVTPEDIAAIREQYLRGVPPGIQREIEERLDAVSIPATMPYFSAIRIEADHTVWLGQYQPLRSETIENWFVVDSTGALLGRMAVPAAFDLHEVSSDGLLGVWMDEYEVEYVRRYEVER